MLNRKEKRRHSHQFTLIEIMIVVVIIAMLAALVGPNILKNLDKAKINTTKAQLINLKDAVNQYNIDQKAYPATLQDLIVNPGLEKWGGPYLNSKILPKDGWDNEFQYTVDPQSDYKFDIISFGADKTSGGTGENEDLSCWNIAN